uniref:Nebulin-related anchoring protein n=1 Tax=Hucho hucho TaxID=62062 RepID=A0A4W5RFZ5_9TELE
MVQAEKNKSLYSERLYKATFEKNRHQFKYTSDTPFFQAAKNASVIINDRRYRAAYEKTKDKYSSVLDDPRNLLAKENAKNSQVKLRLARCGVPPLSASVYSRPIRTLASEPGA